VLDVTYTSRPICVQARIALKTSRRVPISVVGRRT
jgi:hypothetical protein